MKYSFKTCFKTDFFTLEEKISETDKPYYRYNSNSSSISVVLDAEGYLLMDRCKNPDHLFFGYELSHSSKARNTLSESEFPVVKVPRLDFATRLANGDFKQLGALSIIALIDYSFNVRFLADPYSSLLKKGLLT